MKHLHFGKWYLMRINRLNERRIQKQRVPKGKVIPVHAMKAYRGSGSAAPLILNLGTRWEVNCQHHGPVPGPPRETIPGTHSRGGWVGSRTSLGVLVKTKILLSLSGTEDHIIHPTVQALQRVSFTSSESQLLVMLNRILVTLKMLM